MNRQYQVIYNNEQQGKFTIVCKRGSNGGWIARPKYRANWGGWSLSETAEFINKNDAINCAMGFIEQYCEINGCNIVKINQANWNLI